MKPALWLTFFLLAASTLFAQRVPKYDRPSAPQLVRSGTPAIRPLALKRPGHYSTADWRQLVDAAWGPGFVTADKLMIFDTFWSRVDMHWGGFPNLAINWDSLRNVYRPIVEAGVSKGRFAGILTRLTRTLDEWHAYAYDSEIDLSMGSTGEDAEYPDLPSFRYEPGIPLLNLGATILMSPLGAGVTTIQDSLALVYSVMPGHPLGLSPGDIILGYDGVPWRQLLQELLDAEVPAIGSGSWGSTREATNHNLVRFVGLNWGLFDTIDVMKFPDNHVLHLPTAPLKTLKPPYFQTSEQLPLPGVALPDIYAHDMVSWGVVNGTDIGYIYVLDWFGAPEGKTMVQFGEAVHDLIHVRNVKGLILDVRTNLGGWEQYANEGFKQIFAFDPTDNYGRWIRNPGTDHFSGRILSAYTPDYFTPSGQGFTRPIAVLTGPMCGSAGDYDAFRLRFHPLVRFFGKPTAGAYVDETYDPIFVRSPYKFRVDDGSVYSRYRNEGIMIHKAFPVDEEVWLTREGVAAGRDSVANRALQWIRSVSYARTLEISRHALRPGVDSCVIRAAVDGPGATPLNVLALLKDVATGAQADSILLYNDGSHGDLNADDTSWGRKDIIRTEGVFTLSVLTKDLLRGTRFETKSNTTVVTAGPVRIASWHTLFNADTTAPTGENILLRIGLRNHSSTYTLRGVAASITPLNQGADHASPEDVRWDSIPSGGVVTYSSNAATLYLADSIEGKPELRGMRKFALTFSCQGIVFAEDTLRITVTGVGEATLDVPNTYTLVQNFPNPFNPSTKIRFSLANRGMTDLIVYDLLGREIATLVHEVRDPGTYAVRFNGSQLPSGTYFYRLRSGEFTETKRMLLVK